jgi:hypothetical protein
LFPAIELLEAHLTFHQVRLYLRATENKSCFCYLKAGNKLYTAAQMKFKNTFILFRLTFVCVQESVKLGRGGGGGGKQPFAEFDNTLMHQHNRRHSLTQVYVLWPVMAFEHSNRQSSTPPFNISSVF